MTKREIKKLLKLHKLWLDGNPNGARMEIHDTSLRYANLHNAVLIGANLSYADLGCADLTDADLIGANLSYADLRYADLGCADLTDADLIGANLSRAELSGADLSGADLTDAFLYDANLRCTGLSGTNLRGAELSGANLSGAELSGANLSGAELSGANLRGVSVTTMTTGYSMACPTEGSYIAWKKCGKSIVKLLIPETAKRSSATTMKCRASEATVLEIQTLKGRKSRITSVHSDFTKDFVYTVGKTVKVKGFNTDRWAECTNGIHHFLDREMAVQYD